MNREEIIKLSREADLVTWGFQSLEWEPVPNMEAIERFAALVAAAEREACARGVEIFDRTFQTGGGIAGSIRSRGNV